ncbi:MAG: Mu transposase C-terminal domain-containing protein [Prochloraceae cyanobacterium]|nr:Mu transposase C-terminal domain-containing protein [Prochloraceae cyanobacterium]
MIDSIVDNNGDIDREKNEIIAELDEETKKKIEVIQTLLEPCDRKTYGLKLQEAAIDLGKSKRTVQRLVKKWEEEGLAGLNSTKRSDRGSHRINEELQKFIIKTYQEGNKGSKRITPKQVFLRTKAKALEMGIESPSHMTVYRMLNPLIEKKKKAKSIRSPGWRGSQLSVKTRAGQDISVEYSNHVWQCDHTRVDVLLVDKYGELLTRPWLTTVIDTYSRCIMGINLGYDAPSSQVVALALRHAILLKRYGIEYGLHEEWGTYGLPQHFYTDGGKDFRSSHLNQIAVQLGFVCHLRDRPSEGGVVERPFKTLNTELFSTLPGYTGSNVQERPKEAEKEATLTLRDLERLLVRYIVDNYNQSLDARMGDQTRFQRWDSGLITTPDNIQERDLDICLMKQARRKIQRGGYLQFENLMYRGENLAGYAGETVILRYDPKDITQVLVYRQEDNKEAFLARATAQNLETETISLDEAKASIRKIREAGKTISNNSILTEVRDRSLFTLPDNKTRKQRQKEEQAELPTQKKVIKTETFDEDEDVMPPTKEIPQVEVLDYQDLIDDYGF